MHPDTHALSPIDKLTHLLNHTDTQTTTQAMSDLGPPARGRGPSCRPPCTSLPPRPAGGGPPTPRGGWPDAPKHNKRTTHLRGGSAIELLLTCAALRPESVCTRARVRGMASLRPRRVHGCLGPMRYDATSMSGRRRRNALPRWVCALGAVWRSDLLVTRRRSIGGSPWGRRELSGARGPHQGGASRSEVGAHHGFGTAHCNGTTWHYAGTPWALHWHYTGMTLPLHWNCTGTAMVLQWLVPH